MQHQIEILKTTIKNITKIQTGLFAQPSSLGEIVYIQAKHFDELGNLNDMLYPDLPNSAVSQNHILQNGDVLYAAKGTKNFAVLYDAELGKAVASTSFFVIRLKVNNILPAYLTWFLNNIRTQSYLKSQAIGSSTPSISKQVLENLEIIIPALEQQKIILEITKVRRKEKELMQKIDMLRETLIQQTIFNNIN